jgi:hypothetical protein
MRIRALFCPLYHKFGCRCERRGFAAAQAPFGRFASGETRALTGDGREFKVSRGDVGPGLPWPISFDFISCDAKLPEEG